MTVSHGYPPLFQKLAALKGFLAGCLFVGGFANNFLPLQVILFAAGVFVFIDAIIPDGHTFVMLSILFALFGGLIAGVIALVGLGFYWSILIGIVTLVYYFYYFTKKKRTSD
ncbi:MAG: hypothetical protein ISS93_01780 [Candidatus Aenigmarchaeota archaeon]|nr:hypothetical protein [Candidatus Aenigmarchaeota archaeon]